MKAVLIAANGEVRRSEIADYHALNAAVGGYIEAIHFGDTGHYAYLNEDGTRLNLPYNQKATSLCAKHDVGLMPGDFIKGTMVVVGPPDGNGDDTDISDELATYLENVK